MEMHGGVGSNGHRRLHRLKWDISSQWERVTTEHRAEHLAVGGSGRAGPQSTNM